MTRNRLFKTLGLSVISCALISGAPKFARAQDAETYYIGNIEAIVQAKCIACHVSGGQAGSTSLRFGNSASSNHDEFKGYVTSPSRASRVLSKIRGVGHGGGLQVAEGSGEYDKFTEYMSLLTDEGSSQATVPGAPANVSASAGNERATVSFTAPTDNGGAAITSYTAESTPGANRGSCAASPCTVAGLSNGTSYTFSVTATNEIGEGPASAESNAVTPTAPSVFRVALEEPVQGNTHTGVGNLRGWALASDGIDRVDISIDGVFAFSAPYGGVRQDVGGAFPDIPGSGVSGYSLAFNYSDLEAGTHTITATAYTSSGEEKSSSAIFTVVRFPQSFIPGTDAVVLDNASCTLAGDEVSIVDALVENSVYDLRMKWRTAEQGFEIIEIR